MSKQQRPIDRIAPDDLPEQVDADVETVDDALEYLQQHGDSTTPDGEQPRCPVDGCGSIRVYPLPGCDSMKEYNADYRCDNGHHFDDPVYPDADDADGDEKVDLDAVDGIEVDDEPDDEPDDDPFEWVAADDLAKPPITRQLAELDDRALTALAIYLYAPWEDAGPSYRDLEEIWPYQRNWIGDRVRAWRDGEFRDLVADPRPWRVDE